MSTTPSTPTHLPASKKKTVRSFDETMADITRPMSKTERIFSKFIHSKEIERISDIIGSTIARPNALLLGALLSFAFTLLTYLIAKDLGYRLSGFESIGAFLLGWVLGLIYDFLRLMVSGGKSS